MLTQAPSFALGQDASPVLLERVSFRIIELLDLNCHITERLVMYWLLGPAAPSGILFIWKVRLISVPLKLKSLTAPMSTWRRRLNSDIKLVEVLTAYIALIEIEAGSPA